MSFKVEYIYRLSPELVSVKVSMPIGAWNTARALSQLGHLYGVDISNAVYRSSGVKASMPTVDDSARAKGGIKVIELTYADSTWVDPRDSAGTGLDYDSIDSTDLVDNVIYVDFIKRTRKAA